MDKEQFAAECEKADSKLATLKADESDVRGYLASLNDCIKIVRVVRIKKRARIFVLAFTMLALGAAVLGTGLAFGEGVGLITAVLFAAALIALGSMWGFSNLRAITHKAVVLRENGKVREFIYSSNGKFIYNTIEGETVFDKGVVKKTKHDHTKYEPLFPYADFLDKDFSDFLKARSGHGYEEDETYRCDAARGTVSVCGAGGKKRKFVLYVEDGKPYKMDYLYSESYVYSRMNDHCLAVHVPKALKGKINIPAYINVEYVEQGEDFKKLWEKL